MLPKKCAGNYWSCIQIFMPFLQLLYNVRLYIKILNECCFHNVSWSAAQTYHNNYFKSSSVFLQKSFRDLHKVVQGCTTKTRPKVASATSHVRILTSLVLWCSEKLLQVYTSWQKIICYSGSRYWECGTKERLGDSLWRKALNRVNENHAKQLKNDIKEANESSWTPTELSEHLRM